jgi:aspartyl protease family protein
MQYLTRLGPLVALLALAPLPSAWGEGAGVAPLAPQPSIEAARAPDGLFYVTVQVNGQPIRFLVDTGASHMTLSADDAARLHIDRATMRYGGQIETANGRQAIGWTRLAEIEVGTHRIEDVPAAVVDGGLPVSLLGQNLLSRFDQVKIEGDRLSLS